MGFYGNITNTSRTQFIFDRTYASRYEMDTNCKSDGVYAGRYVLVEYDTDTSEDTFHKGFYCVDNVMYTGIDTHGTNAFCGPITSLRVNSTDIKDGDIAKIDAGKCYFDLNKTTLYIMINGTSGDFTYVEKSDYDNYWLGKKEPDLEDPNSLHGHIQNEQLSNFNKTAMPNGIHLAVPAGYKYNVYTTGTRYYMASINSDNTVSWNQINTTEAPTNYFTNFNIDFTRYGTSRGYDSTVWQKVYTSTPDSTTGSPNQGRYEKYVMIAELNTVVPTFDIVADPPSLVPITPHFDTDSTNIYYKFHWQPQWGFRTKAAKRDYLGPSITSGGEFSEIPDVDMSTDDIIYPSDQKTSWYGEFYNTMNEMENSGYYDPKNKTWVKNPNDNTNFDAAIYYNAAGFKSDTIVKSADILDKNRPSYDQYIKSSGWEDKDEIKLAPTGLSGNTYKQHNGLVDTKAQEDTQEFSMMLPSLGNAISDIWDIVYGGRDTNESINETNKRNLDIQWEDAANAPQRQGLRLVNDDLSKNGFYLTDIEANTLAGCINSIHDLMGMIIVDNSDELDIQPETVDPDAIYYFANEGVFKRKHEGFDYTELSYTYEKADLTEDTYFPNFYYLDNTGAQIATEAFDINQSYYQKKLSADAIKTRYAATPLSGWITGAYYKTPAGEYRKETASFPAEATTYYSFDEAATKKFEIELGGEYEPNKYYYSQTTAAGTTIFNLSTDNIANPQRNYYSIDESKTVLVNNSMRESWLYDDTTGLYNNDRPLTYIYAPNRFFYRGIDKNGNETGNFIREGASVAELAQYWDEDTGELKRPITYVSDEGETKTLLDSDGNTVYYQYLMLDAQASKDTKPIYITDENGNVIQQDAIPVGALDINGVYKISLIKFEAEKFYFKEGDGIEIISEETGDAITLTSQYVELTLDILQSHYDELLSPEEGSNPIYRNYYSISAVMQGAFYTPNTFWYQTAEGNWAKDKGLEITTVPKRTYYKNVVFNLLDNIYYIPNKYYILDPETNEYVIDDSKDFDTAKTYYKKENVYVKEDTSGIYPIGTVWTSSMNVIPATIKIATRESKWEMIELTGFARNLNTIHGLILRLNKLAEFDDLETRDTRTIQGALNSLNDYLNKFKALPSSRFVITDSYGRLEGAPWTTAQAFETTNWQESHTEKNAIDVMERRWINFDLNSNPSNPQIIIKHNFNQVDDTTTTSNKNLGIQTGTEKGNNDTTDDTLKIITPIVDNMGHTVGKNTETVTLPYGFKTFNFSNSIAVTDAINLSTDDLVAKNTKDTMTLAMSNKWLKFSAEVDNNKFYIGHVTSGVAKGSYGLANNESITTLDKNNTFEIPYFTVDEAGHITAAQTNTVTIPENFKNVTISAKNSEESDSIGSTEDTIAADSLEDTLTIIAGNKWINLEADAANDIITAKHYVKAFDQTDVVIDLNGADNKTFAIQKINWDKAGHLISSENRTFTLPYNYKTLAIANTGLEVTDVGTKALEAIAGNLVATTHVDTATIDTGNRWIRLIANGKTVTLVHAEPGAASITKGDEKDQTPVFGSTFKVPYVQIDEAGHVKNLTDHTITIPLPSLSDTLLEDTQAAVLTTIDLTPTTGALTTTHKNIGLLLLTGYSLPTSVSENKVAAADSINTAFGKLQYAIDWINDADTREGSTNYKIKTAINALDKSDLAIDGSFISAVTQENGIISVSRATLDPSLSFDTTNEVPTLNIKVNTKTGTAQSLPQASISQYGVVKLSNSLTSNSETIAATSNAVKLLKDTIDDLDVINTASSSTFISSLTQADGKIAYLTTGINPIVTIEAGTASAAPTVNISVGGNSAAPQSITTATTDLYGVVKLSSATNDNSETLAATPKAVKEAYDLAANAVKANTSIDAVGDSTLLKIKYDEKGLITGSEVVAAADFDTFGFVINTNTFEYTTPPTDTETEIFDEKDKTIEWLFKKVASLEARITELESK